MGFVEAPFRAAAFDFRFLFAQTGPLRKSARLKPASTQGGALWLAFVEAPFRAAAFDFRFLPA
jgi:hypothetical protein